MTRNLIIEEYNGLIADTYQQDEHVVENQKFNSVVIFRNIDIRQILTIKHNVYKNIAQTQTIR